MVRSPHPRWHRSGLLVEERFALLLWGKRHRTGEIILRLVMQGTSGSFSAAVALAHFLRARLSLNVDSCNASVTERNLFCHPVPLCLKRMSAELLPVSLLASRERSTTMLAHILVPLDGSLLAETALQPAARLAQRFDARLLLLVRSTDTWPKEEPFPADDLLAAFQAGDYLMAVARRLRDAGLAVQVEVSAEAPASGISAEAHEHQADLIVMATHGRQRLDALLHPSVTWSVLRLSKAPILTWKVTEGADQAPDSSWIPRFLQDATAPILVPLDGSLLAEQALPLAEELAQRLGNPLLLVRAAEQPYVAGSAIDYPAILARAQEWSLAEATSYLERKRLELASAGLHVDIDSQLGEAPDVIEASVQDHQVGLVVMASHGRSGVGRLLLGSVARRLLSCLEVPIVLVRHHPESKAATEVAEDDQEK